MSNFVTLKALGLNTSPNALNQSDGAMAVASNVVISRDNIVESRRGYSLYGNSFGTTSDVLKQVFNYKTRILRHYDNTLQFDSNGSGDFLSFAGNYTEPQTGLRIKSIEANQNCYFTSSNGIQKISTVNINDLSTDPGFITPAGGIKALDLSATLDFTTGQSNGFLPQDSTVAYEVVWGTNDVNQNLILGTPSQSIVVYNPLTNLVLNDFNNLLLQLDNLNGTGSLITDGDYVSSLFLPNNSSAQQLQINLIALAAKIDNDILYADTVSAPLQIATYANASYIDSGNLYITFTNSGLATTYWNNPARPLGTDEIAISGFTAAVGTLPSNGPINSIQSSNSTIGSISSNTITTTTPHSFNVNTPVTFSGTLPSGVSANTIYYVIGTNFSSTTFEIATTIGATMGLAISGGAGGIISTNYISIPLPTANTPSGAISFNLPTITSYNYENIQQPPVPATPPVDNDEVALQTYLTNIFTQLQDELPVVIPAAAQTEFISGLTVTTSANVTLNITIPESVTPNYFFQIYRTQTLSATGTTSLINLSPGNELQQAYEAFPTTQDLENGYVVVTDVTPDAFLGANLYTNPVSGDGTLQANEVPPLALDINRFQGYTFYANTSTRQRLSLSLLGVQKMLTDYDNGIVPTLSISTTNGSNLYSFVKGLAQEYTITFSADISNSLDGTYFLLYSADDMTEYYVWYHTVSGTDPMIPNAIGIEVLLNTNDSAITVASKTLEQLSLIYRDISVAQSSSSFGPSNVNTGTSTITLTVAPDVQPFNLNDPIFISSTGTLPAPLSSSTQYYIINPTSTTVQLSTSMSGSPVTITTQGTGIHTIKGNSLYLNNTNVGYTTGFNAGTSPFTSNTLTSGQGERISAQKQTITTTAGASFNSSGTSNYFLISNPFNRTNYYIWFQNNTSTDPLIPGFISEKIVLTGTETNTQIASFIAATLNGLPDFSSTSASNIASINNVNSGPSDTIDVSHMPGGTTTATTLPGALDILLSTDISPAVAIDTTAKSMVRVINRNTDEQVFAYYLSGVNNVPGSMLLEARNLSVPEFYLLANDDNTGSSFNPVISPTITITNVTAADPAVITTSSAHGLNNGDSVLISNDDSSSVPNIDGIYLITYISPTSFSIPVNVLSHTVNTAVAINLTSAQNSSNEKLPNRIYYSKFSQPEAVPLLNTIDVGDEDKAIVRILPLRNSLFVFKQEGLYRISGVVAPFSTALFDTSVNLIAADSLGITNNTIYAWTSQGIQQITEAGAVPPISRPIDVDLLTFATYPNFSSATWGIGYNSDHSYLVSTVLQSTDTVAQVIYRFSLLTSTWTTYDKTNTCGLINIADDKLYMGAGDTNFLEKERKNFLRSDFADREISQKLNSGSYFNQGTQLALSSITNVNVGDVVYQQQYITPYIFNSLLQTIDNDIGPSTVKISSISTGSTVTITTTVPHTLTTGDTVFIQNTNSLPVINGTYTAVVVNSTHFTVIPQYPVIVAGTAGTAKYSYYHNLQVQGGSNLRSDLVTFANRLDQDPNLTYGQYSNLIINETNISITSNSISNPTVVYSPGHGLVTGRLISIQNVVGSSPTINNEYNVVVLDSDHFTVPVNVLTGGTGGTFDTIVQDFTDIQACYNAIIQQLNLDPGTTLKHYPLSTDTTEIESVILSVNPVNKLIDLSTTNNFVQGPITIFNAIACSFTYLPVTFGDPLSYKHLGESTMIFTNKAFTLATLSFASDLLPQFINVTFPGDGAGFFGTPGFGTTFFGGASNSAPFRTYVPRNTARCRYLTIKFSHTAAREVFGIYGMTISGESTQSTRAYR